MQIPSTPIRKLITLVVVALLATTSLACNESNVESAQLTDSATITSPEPTPMTENIVSINDGWVTAVPDWVMENAEREIKRLEELAAKTNRPVVATVVRDDCPFIVEIEGENVEGTICVEPPRIDDWD